MDIQLALLLRLAAAHLLVDFAFHPLLRSRSGQQPVAPLRDARTYVHALVAAGLTYVLAGRWSALWILPVVFAVHLLSDAVAPRKADREVSLLDQAAHLAVLVLIWFILLGSGRGGATVYLVDLLRGETFWIITVAYAIVVWPCGIIVGRLTSRWRDEAAASANGLSGAGLWIGRLERVLVVTFVLLDRFEAIGFLIAAKSILRIGEVTGHNDRGQAEYILVGTMLSLILAIVTGLAAARLLG
ncbi:MAG: DUF3307 domain-containing protein [Chloroflexota bacterium]